MRPTARATTCPTCGRDEPPGARWCGDCGARLVRTESHQAHDVEGPAHHGGTRTDGVDDAGAAAAPPRRARRRWGWLVAVVVAVTAASVLVDPAPAGDATLLGRLDDATGRSSLLAPTDGLQLLWRRPVDVADGAATAPPALVDLGGGTLGADQVPVGQGPVGQLLLGDEVVDLATGAVVVDLTDLRAGTGGADATAGADGTAGADAAPRSGVGAHPLRPDRGGRVAVLDDGDVVVVDGRTGRVDSRASLAAGPWTPIGGALGWVAGAAVFADADGVVGAVEETGRVRWVGEPGWSWDGTGHGTDWLVVRHGGSSERVLAVDGGDGTVALDVGPADTVHAPVVHGDSVVWVDPLRGVDRGLGHPVQVRGARLDGTGGEWTATHLSPTSGRPTAVQVTAVSDSVVVRYWATGDTTAAVWLDPADGSQVGFASVHGSGRTEEGWPVTAVVDGGLAHVDRSGRRIRLVDRSGDERWSIPAAAGEGVLAHGTVVLVRTPPRGTSLQSGLRLVDVGTGDVLWDRVVDGVQHQRLVGVLDGHVGVAAGEWPVPLRDQSWLALDTGRRRPGTAMVAEVLDMLDASLLAAGDLVLLGSVPSEGGARPVLLLPGANGPARIIGLVPGEESPTAASLLADPTAPGGPIGTVADHWLAVTVGAGSVVATDPRTGRERWRVLPDVAQHTDRAVLLGEVVVTVGVDGVARAWDREDGTRRWQGPAVVTTALTAGGEAVVLGTATGEVVVLDAAGRVQQRVRVGGDPVEDVAVVDGRVLAAVGQDLVALGRGTVVVDPADQVPVP